ncbi:hypothetical protein [Halomonas sp. HL-93]|uniref:hypothetical protein n=1 Tax=Halomonas sp. HL-93 TaxID=1666906 RepID=UPI0012E720D1|nr:hypothetical protein [Halomonas sp. HL-93]
MADYRQTQLPQTDAILASMMQKRRDDLPQVNAADFATNGLRLKENLANLMKTKLTPP